MKNNYTLYYRITLFSLFTFLFSLFASAQLCFDPAADNRYETGERPQQVAHADFNNDGKLDVAAANSIGGGVSVLFGNGDGTFDPQLMLTTSASNVECIATGDFNSDTKPDIVVMSRANAEVELFINNGNGTFQASVPFTFGVYSSTGFNIDMRAADLTGDGKIDLVLNDIDDDLLIIVKNNGNSTLSSIDTLYTSDKPSYVAVGDLNNDGNIDVITAGSNSSPNNDTIRYYINSGNGTFTTNGFVTLGLTNGYYRELAIADVDGNNFGDIIAGGTTDIRIFLNNGSLVFTQQPSVFMGGYPFEILVADVNNDLKLDLISPIDNEGVVAVARGNGNGTFQAFEGYSANGKAYHCVLGDFDGDTRSDLINACRNNDYVTFLKGNSDGSFGPYSLRTSLRPSALAIGFVNNDAFEDIVAVHTQSLKIATMLGNGDGTFQNTIFDSCWQGMYDVVLGDFNNDLKTDAVAVGSTTHILAGNNSGHFNNPVTVNHGFPGGGKYSAAAGDFNHDNNLDLAVVYVNADTVSILLGNGNFTFAAPVKYGLGDGPGKIITAYVNADSHLDLLVPNDLSNSVSLLLGNANGTFQTATSIATGAGPRAVAAEDFNNDGMMDFATSNSNALNISVHLATSPGVFAAPVNYSTGSGSGPSHINTGFVNADTIVDLLVVIENKNQVAVFIGNPDGTFQSYVSYSVDDKPYEVASADFNNDNVDDIATVNYNANNVSVILNNSALITAGGNTTICTGDSVLLTASGGFSYLWSTGATTASIYASAAATYSCSVTNQAGDCTIIPPSITVTVSGSAPVVTYNVINNDHYCISDGTVALAMTGGQPQGGTYSGNFITNGVLNMTQAGAGPHLVTYTYTDPGGCGSGTDTDTIFVDNEVLANISLPSDTFCSASTSLNLIPFGTPAGGEWIVNGVAGDTIFDPQTFGVGSGTFVRYVNFNGGCKDTSTQILYVVDTVHASLDLPADTICNVNNTITLVWGSPSGGTYYVDGVQMATVNPSTVSLGMHTVSYAYNIYGCYDSTSANVFVKHCVSGINETENAFITVFPNPNSGSFIVSIENDAKFLSLKIFDVSGRIVLEKNISGEKTIAVNAGLARGVYVLQLNNYEKVLVKKLVIE